MALPSGYTPLEYIESTGSQYVDTGFKPKYNTRVVMDQQLTTWKQNCALFGARSENSGSAPESFCHLSLGETNFRSDYFGTAISVTVDTVLKRYVVDKNQNVTTIDGKVITNNASTTSCSNSLILFGAYNAEKINLLAHMKLYFCRIYDNGVLIRDYIPVQRLDGTVGLLDQVNNVFYPDAAGGNFIPGPLAARPEAPASLEVIGTTRNAAVLAWPGAPVGQSYRLYRDGVVVYEGSALCYTDTGLTAGSAHVYSVHTVIGSTESEGVTTEATTTEGIVLITDRTAADASAGRRKGYYNALDLIRVGEAMAYLEERFAAVGISVTVSPKLNWQLSDIPTHAQAHRYLTDIGVLRGKLTEFRETVSLPGALTALTWGQANDIEIILLDVENLIHTIILSYRHYTGRAISGVNALP